MIGVIIFVIAILAIAIFIGIEIKKMKRKLIVIFLISLVLFTYFSINAVFKGREVDLKTIPGVISAVKIYFSWLGTVFSNLKTITSNVINMNWKGNATG